MSRLVRRRHARHVPVRTCAGCGTRAPGPELRRFALASNGGVEWRPTGGRGSYLHPSADCAGKFVARKKLVPGLRARVAREARVALVAAAGLGG